jgi:hypothetical protein
MNAKGLLAWVYRTPGPDCTAGGITAKHNAVVLLGTDGSFEAKPDGPPGLYLARWYGRLIACPEDLERLYPKKHNSREDCSIESLGGWMVGGNFVYTCDSRMPGKAPIHVYDRREW